MTWMAWTPQTATFFIAIAIALSVMTTWELRSPTRPEKGFLPMLTTRGDRFFISLLSAAFIHIFWMALVGEWLVFASGIALVWAALVMWRG